MSLRTVQTIAYAFLLFIMSCQGKSSPPLPPPTLPSPAEPLMVGAERVEQYLGLLKGKKVGLVVNQTSTINQSHLVDSLLALGVDIQLLFAPEHGFRGEADAGEQVVGGKDAQTGLSIVSLYGKNKKPSAEQLAAVDIMLFDIQDVGARFYTYISTMHYVMEACAENGKPLIVLDRPNPNGDYVDGPVLEMKHQSFVGMHPIPIVHGLTVGELAKMINGENWLSGGTPCDLTVISCANYTHQTVYELPVKPSPNLPNYTAIRLYPSLCLFEGTVVSVGRGTETQFQVIGSPDHPHQGFSFTPVPKAGAKYPLHQNKACYGKNLQDSLAYQKGFFLDELIHFYQNSPNKSEFFNNFFTNLAGTRQLQKQVEQGLTSEDIKASWQENLDKYRKMREKYLLYE